ncbi:MAG: class I SAM-dependent RNA methyltransferase, partial [Chloroflexi bacterium]|nr:class I SAM-dependent RNA methyltransferase [Chloroflexota bacterium]
MPNTPLKLQLTTMSNGPGAIGRHEGRAVFVPFAIPGETALVEITEEKSSFARARLVEVLSASPDRVAPVCPHFGACGGCHWQHLAYPAQLKWKQQIVIDQLARIGGIESPRVLETLPAPDPLRYRNHLQFAQDSEGRLGFMAANSKAVVPIRECHIARPEIMAVFDQLDLERLEVDRVSLRAGAEGEVMLVFESESGEPPEVETDLPVSVASVDSAGETVTLIGAGHLIEEVRGRRFRVSAGSFFQVNT